MRVGFITQLLWPRYGPFWHSLVRGVGAEAALPEAGPSRSSLSDPRLGDVPGTALKLAAAQALSLQHCDLILAPDLNPGPDVPRGGGQDPWIASFPEALASRLSGLPPVLGVPASLDDDLGADVERLAIEVLMRLGRDGAAVRRVWERWRSAARSPRQPEASWQRPASATETVGVLGQPWLLSDALVALRAQEGRHLIAQHRLSPAQLRAEGERLGRRLVPTDAEVLGAGRLLGRRGDVTRLELIVDETSGADAWLAQQLKRLGHKPLHLLRLRELAPPDELLSALEPEASTP